MEDKHIFSTSKWKRFTDYVITLRTDINKEIQKYSKYKAERKAKQIARPPKEKESKTAPQKPAKYKAPKIEPETSTIKPLSKISKEAENKILTYTLIISIITIMALGIILSKRSPASKQLVLTPTLIPVKSISTPAPFSTNTWETYTSSNGVVTFKYPPEWYWEPYIESEEAQSVDFFLEGTPADHSSGDHSGNEVFSINTQKDVRTLEEIKNNYYNDATVIYLSGKPTIRTSSNLYIIKPNSDYLVNIMTGKLESEELRNQILSTFKFMD